MGDQPIQNDTTPTYIFEEIKYFKDEEGNDSKMPKSFQIRRVLTGRYFVDEDFNLSIVEFVRVLKLKINELRKEFNPMLVDTPIVGGLNVQSAFGPSLSNYKKYPADVPITAESVLDQLSKLINSDDEFHISDAEFQFDFGKKALLLGAGQFKKPSWWKNCNHSKTFNQLEDRFGPVNCAAVAITFNLNPSRYNGDRLQLLISTSRKLQNDLSWGDNVSVDQLGKIVDILPDHKLLVFGIGTIPIVVAIGNDYIRPIEQSTARKPPKVITLYYDLTSHHYVSIQSPIALLRNQGNSMSTGFCYVCDKSYKTVENHDCSTRYKRDPKAKHCKVCQGFHFKQSECKFFTCRYCSATMERYQEGKSYEFHRCPIIDTKENKIMNTDLNGSRGTSTVFAWDIESRREMVYSDIIHQDFEVDEDYVFRDIELINIKPTKFKQIATLVCVKHVFTDFKIKFEGEDCLEKFVDWAYTRNGDSIFFAHNSSGYDSRLLFDMLMKKYGQDRLGAIPRGAKFLQIKIGKKLYFRDSMCHFPGPLKNLGKTLQLPNMQKGDFPHLFNTIENYDYEGPLPEKKYFDLSFTAKTEKDYQEFCKWHDERSSQGPWNFQKELLQYCEQDVLILAEYLKMAHEKNTIRGRESPLFSITGPSYVNKMSIRSVTRNMELPDPKLEPDIFIEKMDYYSKNSWCHLKDEEYWFAKKCLRGGRTDARCFYYKLTDEQKSLGWKIVYQDVVSLYPTEQIRQNFPVGYPTMYWYEPHNWPCREHASLKECTCHTRQMAKSSECTKIVHEWDIDIDSIINAPDFFGFVKIDATPPIDLYHPVLIHYDEVREKCIASLEPIIGGHFTTEEVLAAVSVGYKITKLYAYHKYKKADSLWGEDWKAYVYEKLLASSDDIDEETINGYERLYEMGDMLRKAKTQGLFKKDLGARAIAKINANCGWGKHCQNPHPSEMDILDDMANLSVYDKVMEVEAQGRVLKKVTNVGSKNILITEENAQKKRINFGSGYLPAGCYVPAYGRLTLWNELNKLGERALYNDTDSIIYIYKPEEYNIPKGKILGEWEEEDISNISEHGGIVEFVAFGPKSYGIKCDDGYTIIKCKGVRTNRATDRIFNFDKMVNVVKECFNEFYSKEGEESVKKKIKIPQLVFQWVMGRGMFNYTALKEFGFDTESLKGKIGPDYKLYPFGYQE